jgi:hypothetical protein
LKAKTTEGELNKVLKREGLPMSEEEYNEWVKAFKDIEESIDGLYVAEEKEKLSYLRMKQQELF